MAVIRCLDGSTLGVEPVAVLDRDGRTYEVTLRLTRDGADFGEVGERCGYFLAAAATRLDRARADGSEVARRWPDPEDRFPSSSVEGGLRAWAADEGRDADQVWRVLERYLPRDRELFSFRHRDPDDQASTGELRCWVRVHKNWVEHEGRGRWRLAQRAVLEAWGDAGVGVRAVLTSSELSDFLHSFVGSTSTVGVAYDGDDGSLLRRPAG